MLVMVKKKNKFNVLLVGHPLDGDVFSEDRFVINIRRGGQLKDSKVACEPVFLQSRLNNHFSNNFLLFDPVLKCKFHTNCRDSNVRF